MSKLTLQILHGIVDEEARAMEEVDEREDVATQCSEVLAFCNVRIDRAHMCMPGRKLEIAEHNKLSASVLLEYFLTSIFAMSNLSTDLPRRLCQALAGRGQLISRAQLIRAF